MAAGACQNLAMRRRRRARQGDSGAAFRRVAARLGLQLQQLGALLGYSPRQMVRFVRHPSGRATPRLRRALEGLAEHDPVSAEELASAYGLVLSIARAAPAPATASGPAPAPASTPARAPARAHAPTPAPALTRAQALHAAALAFRDALRALGDALVLLAPYEPS